jgi:hypothetical protein
MSFGTDLNTIMNADTSINTWCDGGIFFENLPDNFDLAKTWLGYSFRKNSQTDCLNSRGLFTTYGISVKIISTDTHQLETISDYVASYLNGKKYGDIYDIWLVNDSHGMDLEKGIYMNSLEFQGNYVE